MPTYAVHLGYLDGWSHGTVAIEADSPEAAARKAIHRAEIGDSEIFERIARTDHLEGFPVFCSGVQALTAPFDPAVIITPCDGEPEDCGQNVIMRRFYDAPCDRAVYDRLISALQQIAADSPDEEPDSETWLNGEPLLDESEDYGSAVARWQAGQVAKTALEAVELAQWEANRLLLPTPTVIVERDRYRAALQAITYRAPDDKPEEEDYDDTESAFNNGHDCASWEAGQIAETALADGG
jgi:hypothetical protein